MERVGWKTVIFHPQAPKKKTYPVNNNQRKIFHDVLSLLESFLDRPNVCLNCQDFKNLKTSTSYLDKGVV